MKKLSSKGIKILKIFHLIFVMMWVVSAITMGLIYFTGPQSGDELYMSFRIMRFIDDFILIPGAMLTVITGVIYGIFTNWGFFKYRWITVKWIVSILIIIAGTFILSPWLDACIEISDNVRDSALSNADILRYSDWIFTGAVIQSTALIVLIVISVLKPWKTSKNK